jgi:hypothetical protein
LSTLSNYTIDGISGYSHTIESTVSKVAFFGSYNEEKEDALRNLFVSSRVTAIYGTIPA